MNPIPHRWDLSPAEAVALQVTLASRVDSHTPLDLDGLRLVAGVDVSVRGEVSRAAIVVMAFPSLDIVETATASLPVSFPYVPGLLSFREGAVILAAWEQLKARPDAAIFDGAGIAHPRRIGIASHIGLWWDMPTVGCAKTWLVGHAATPDAGRGAATPLEHRGEVVGAVLRTRSGVRPVFVSPGHRATIETACALVLRCATRYRLPEPVRMAHRLAGEF
jgi:deoxyribonuclease V